MGNLFVLLPLNERTTEGVLASSRFLHTVHSVQADLHPDKILFFVGV